jgi:hypothetical protein
VFLQVFQTHVLSISSIFFCMLQVLLLDVSKEDRVLHMEYVWEARGGMSGPRAVNVRAAWAPAWAHET